MYSRGIDAGQEFHWILMNALTLINARAASTTGDCGGLSL